MRIHIFSTQFRYRIDRALRFNRMMEMRKGLESEWISAHEDKILRDNDEREHRKFKFCLKCKF